MFKIMMKINGYLHLLSDNDYRIVPVDVFERAKTQKERGSRIRKPVPVIIDGDTFIFKRNQWDKAKLLGSDYKRFCAGLPQLYKWERWWRFKRNSKRLIPVKSFQ